MEDLNKYFLQPFLNLFRFHKFKIFFVILLTVIFYIVFFPYHQLSNIIESQVSKASRGQVQVSFSDLSISAFPFGIAAKNVSVFTPELPSPLFIEKVYLRPSIGDLLKFKRGGVLRAENILGGNLTAQLSELGQGTSTNKLSKMFKLNLNLNQINIPKLASWAKAPFSTSGALTGQINVTFDQKAFEQPLAQISLKGSKVKLPSVLKIQGNDLNLPEAEWKTMDIQAKLASGQLTLAESTLGVPSDAIYGKIKGTMALSFVSLGGRITPRPSQYDFALDLNLDKLTEQKIGPITTLLLSGKGGKSSTVDGGSRYLLGLKGFPGSSPNIEPLATF